METRRRYRAPDEAPFTKLIVRHSMAGFRMDAMPPLEVRDRYLDTSRGRLLSQGLSLRVRTKGGMVHAALRTIEGDREIAEGRFSEADIEADRFLPEGELRAIVEDYTEGRALEVLLAFRQYRTPRALYEGDRLVGVLSLDVVADQTEPNQPVISNEIEVELIGENSADDLVRLEADLLKLGLEPDPFTKFERGFFRRALRDKELLMLLPREREMLEGYVRSEAAVERRRAEAMLLAADGQDDRAISRRVGLAPSRVRHWRDTFRLERMRMFDDEISAPAVVEEEEPEPGFRVFEVVGDRVRMEREPVRSTDVEGAVRRILDHMRTQRVATPDRKHSGDPFGDVSPGHRPSEPSVNEAAPASPPSDRNDDPFARAGHREFEGAGAHETPSLKKPTRSERVVGIDPLVELADPEQPVHELVGGLFRRSAEELEHFATVVEGEELRNVGSEARPALCRIVSAVAMPESGLADSARTDLESEVREVESAILQLSILHRATESIDARDVDSASEGDPLGLLLARTVWTVETRRLATGDSDMHGLSSRMRDLGRKLSVLVDECHESSGPRRVKDVLASETWRRYEALRILDDRYAAAGAQLPGLDRALKLVEHALALLPGDAAREAQHDVAAACHHLDSFRSNDALIRHLDVFCREWLELADGTGPEVLNPVKEAAAIEAERASEAFSNAFEVLMTSGFRLRLARAIATI